ncbi:Lactonase, 7-bladed beta-propeller-domain-containing protein [Fusarium venenatum]|uniref:Lactonase, 7-bladed beta-propeller-domain-containing protein n=1 Tax=Fusarium venenatum TaxID=56646 RepID=UPI001DF1C2E4|nr:Lactonase, 7-bladed beta-propeller-domain-containing protein [Fusarium venenatum]
MKPSLLLSGDRANFTTLAVDLQKGEIKIVADYRAPESVSWIELESSNGDVDRLIALSEGEESGLLFTFELNHSKKTCIITSQQPTLGAPAHFIALGTYLGGSVSLYPISITEKEGLRLKDTPRTELLPEFPYKAAGHGPNKGRQQQCHVHQVLEDKRGLLYAPDLGADRVWVLNRDGPELKVQGWLLCPPGTGPRHAVLTPDEKLIYVIGELSHNVIAFELSTLRDQDVQPINGFEVNVIPPNVHPGHQFMMDSAEISLHPKIPNVLYVSNRWERHITQREPHLQNVHEQLQGDAIAVILLSGNGKECQEIKHVRTNLDTIRGFGLSDDGKFVVVAGQERGGIEIYSISGDRGDLWTLVAILSEGLDSGIKHAVWL